MPDVLIIGGDSQIGQALHKTFEGSFDYVVLSTTRKWPPADNRLPFDLRYPSFLPKADVTLFCTGINGFKPCADDPVEAKRINVELLLATAKRMHNRGSLLVFLSSSASETHPDTVYGQCKLEAEAGFVELGGACYRFGPVAFPGRNVYPNEIYSPINLSTLTQILFEAVDGLWVPGIHSIYNRDWVKEVA